MPSTTATSLEGPKASKNAINLLQQSWDNSPDNVIMTIAQLFINLSDDQRECSLGVGYLLRAVPDTTTETTDLTVGFTVQRLIDWLVTYDLAGIGIWIVSIMESLASRGEFSLLRDLTAENVYKIARQLAFRARRNDAFMVIRFMLLGYHQSPTLFNNVAKGLIPLLVNCRKTPEDISFATEVCNLAQILVIHFGDADDVGTKVQKARVFLNLPIVSRAEALRTMQETSWKKGLQIQNTSAGTSRRRAVLVQPLGKVGLVNLGNSCFMNSALRALFCSEEFKRSILDGTLSPNSTVRRVKINTPVLLSASIQFEDVIAKQQHNQGQHPTYVQYDLYAVVVHTGESANHGHYYTYARDTVSQDNAIVPTTENGAAQVTSNGQWLLYNDTSVSLSSFDAVEQAAKSRAADTPYVLFFKKRAAPETSVLPSHMPMRGRDSNL
ncbi:Ubiquitin carboxyl-terminal hydrolase 38 [Gryganskiella cystojenkinii]|nr:Ubiquitin carboxyl-terminal hydrolase 38 [Gryganskiella cystojenkinii]